MASFSFHSCVLFPLWDLNCEIEQITHIPTVSWKQVSFQTGRL